MKQIKFLILLSLISNLLKGQYNFYSDESNLFGQRVIETNDGGFLIAAAEYCYTPGAIVIEGCTYAMHLVKTDPEGDTLWTNTINYYTQYGPDLNLFENEDGSFTLFAITNTTYICDGISIGLSGFRQILIVNLNSSGELINNFKFPDNCELILKDIERIDNNQYAILAVYDRPIFFDDPEGRLFIINNDGDISNQIIFPNESFIGGSLIKNNLDDLLLLYATNNEFLKLETYDLELNLLSESISSDLSNSCIASNWINLSSKVLYNGDIGILCDDISTIYQNSQFFRFDSSLNLLSENKFTLNRPTNFMEDNNENIIIASTNETSDTVLNTQINYFAGNGDSLYSLIVYHPENESPQQIIKASTDDYAIVGNVNCCNYDSIIGPSKSFLLFGSQITATNENIRVKEKEITVYPNPTNNFITIYIGEVYNLSKKLQIDFFSSNGKLIGQQKLTNYVTQVKFDHLPNGIYFYKITNDGEFIKNGKIIKNGG